MLTFNRPEHISRAIQSIVDQSFTNWELIVIQDGDNQAIVRILEGWEAKEPRVRYFHRTEPGNIAHATNFGLREARGEYIAILDDDDYWLDTHKLAKQVEFLDGHRDYVGCGGGVITIDEKGQETLRYCKPEHDEAIRRKALLANPMAHSSVLYRKSAVEKCGMYDESLAGFQDWDVCLKMGKLGKLYNFQEYFLCYQIWEGGGSYQQNVKNTRCALTIVERHRHNYQGYFSAYPFAWVQHLYAHVPAPIKRVTFGPLSRLKKKISSHGNGKLPAPPSTDSTVTTDSL